MATEQACGIALNSGYWTSEALCLCRSQIFPGITIFFIFWNSKFWYAPRCERLSDHSFKLATEKRKSVFSTKKNTWRIQSFGLKAKAAPYDIESVKLLVKWDKKKQNARSKYFILPALPTAPPLPLAVKGRIQQTKHIAFINI